jgi:exonuclease V gamma subunit
MKPVHFFPASAHAYAKVFFRPDQDEEKALQAAIDTWNGSGGYKRAEGDNGAYHICFAEAAPFDAEFAELAKRVYGPLIKHVKEDRL